MEDIEKGIRTITRGDLIRMVHAEIDENSSQREITSVVGYATRCNVKGVLVSYHNPDSKDFGFMTDGYSFTKGDRFFYWKRFSHFEIIPVPRMVDEMDLEAQTKIKPVSLVGRLKVSVGNIVHLSGSDFQIAGYITDFKEDILRLSHYDPLARNSNWSSLMQYTREITLGKRWYYLEHFTDYQVIKPEKKEEQLQIR